MALLSRIPILLSQYALQAQLTQENEYKTKVTRRVLRALGHPRVTVPFAGRGYLSVALRNKKQAELARLETSFPEVWQEIAGELKGAEVVWDISAQTGPFSIQAAWDPNVSEVHAFELDPINLGDLRANLSLNNGRVYVHPFRVVGRDALLTCPTSLGPLQVRCLSADSIIAKRLAPKPSLIRILGLKGLRAWVEGARRLVQGSPPKQILVELEAGESARGFGLHEYGLGDPYRWQSIQHVPVSVETSVSFILLTR